MIGVRLKSASNSRNIPACWTGHGRARSGVVGRGLAGRGGLRRGQARLGEAWMGGVSNDVPFCMMGAN